jgi:hypothetical protein
LKLLSYLYGNSKWGIPLGGMMRPSLVIFTDSDWAGDEVSRQSTTGEITFFRGSPVAWSSRRIKSTIAISSTEAEIHASVEGFKRALYIQPILEEMGYEDVQQFTVVIG